MAWLEAKVQGQVKESAQDARDAVRRAMVGSGQRGDKVRTVRFRDGIVTNNLNGKKTSLEKYLDGDFSKLF